MGVTTVLILRLGAAPVIGFIRTGQVIPFVILGWLGLLNLPIRLITLPRLAGAGLGVAIMEPRS